MILRSPSSSGLKGKGRSWPTTITLLVVLLAAPSVRAQEEATKEPPAGGETPKVVDGVLDEPVNETKPVLTGNPQLDYIHDPNLPRELNGYDLSDYPFYKRVPEKDKHIQNFTCDGRHDGFYASVPHKCQVYHHCLFGIRYDFLCANYTAFDQKNFICHFVNEVDCENSELYFDRNDALYEEPSTTTTPLPKPANFQPLPARRPLRPFRLQGKRRPALAPSSTTPAPLPAYDDYYSYDYYNYNDYYDYYYNYDDEVTTTTTTTQRPRRPPGGRRQRPRGGGRRGGPGGPGRPGGPGGPFGPRNRKRPLAPAPFDGPAGSADRPRANRRQEETPARSQALREPVQEPSQDIAPEQPVNSPQRRRRPTRPGLGSGRRNPEVTSTTTQPPPPSASDYDYYDYGNAAPVDAKPDVPKNERVTVRPIRRRVRPVGGTGSGDSTTGSRKPAAEDPVPAPRDRSSSSTTTTEEPARPIRTNRITIRRPISSRRPGVQRETTTTTTTTEAPTTETPSRPSRPRFRNRPQSPTQETRGPSSSSRLRGTAEVEVSPEEAPVAPEVNPVRVGGGRPQRRPGGPGRRRPGPGRRQGGGGGGEGGVGGGGGPRQRVRTTEAPPTYDYYEY